MTARTSPAGTSSISPLRIGLSPTETWRLEMESNLFSLGSWSLKFVFRRRGWESSATRLLLDTQRLLKQSVLASHHFGLGISVRLGPGEQVGVYPGHFLPV